MNKNRFLILVPATCLSLIFLAFFNHDYVDLSKSSIIFFVILSVPYCLYVKDPRKGLILFLLEALMLEGPWKNFTYGTGLKLFVYIIRDLLLYATLINFFMHRKQILSEDVLRQKPPLSGFIFIFLINIFAQLFNPNNFGLLNAALSSRMFWEMVPLYWMGFYLMREKSNFRTLYWALILCVAFNSLAAVLQYSMGKEGVAEIAVGYKVMMYEWGRGLKEKLRPPGLGSDMGFAGFCFAQIIVASVLLFIMPETKQEKKILNFLFIGVLCTINTLGLAVSAARTAVVLAAIHLIILFLIRRDLIKNRLGKAATLIVLFALLVLPYASRAFTLATERYESVKNPLVLIKTITQLEKSRTDQAFFLPLKYAVEFFMGNGLGRVGPSTGLFTSAQYNYANSTNAENALNLSITAIGTIGTIVWILFHVQIVRRGLRIYKGLKDYEWKLHGTVLLSYMVLLLVFWQFGQLVVLIQNAGFWFSAGAFMGMKYIKEHE